MHMTESTLGSMVDGGGVFRDRGRLVEEGRGKQSGWILSYSSPPLMVKSDTIK